MNLAMDETLNTLPIAVTIGEPSGIGPEIILKAWFKRQENRLPPFFVIGSAEILEQQAAQLNLNIPISKLLSPKLAEHIFPNALPVLDQGYQSDFLFKTPIAETAPMVISSIEKAVELIIEGKARAMVTAPIHKAALYSAGFNAPGHTEFLGQLCEKHLGEEYHPVMMLASEELCVVPLTVHVPINEVPSLITPKLLIKTIGIIHEGMKNFFGLPFPKIAVSGLNPHAGESGSMGKEDQEVIAPTLEKIKKQGIHVRGPLPADTMFHKSARAKYDVALCMYHDQALIPIKTIDFDSGVNVTLGLPIVRTSPDHGTALDIAGQSLANPVSIINSIKLADRMSKHLPMPEDNTNIDIDSSETSEHDE